MHSSKKNYEETKIWALIIEKLFNYSLPYHQLLVYVLQLQLQVEETGTEKPDLYPSFHMHFACTTSTLYFG